MFSSHRRIQERKGKYGTDRDIYFKELISEFQGESDIGKYILTQCKIGF